MQNDLLGNMFPGEIGKRVRNAKLKKIGKETKQGF